jgi:hypothetical protein
MSKSKRRRQPSGSRFHKAALRNRDADLEHRIAEEAERHPVVVRQMAATLSPDKGRTEAPLAPPLSPRLKARATIPRAKSVMTLATPASVVGHPDNEPGVHFRGPLAEQETLQGSPEIRSSQDYGRQLVAQLKGGGMARPNDKASLGEAGSRTP